MEDKNDAIEKFLLENLEEYVDISGGEGRCNFYNKNTKI